MGLNMNEKAVLALDKFYNTATENIKMSAVINRALADKKSTQIISKKVSAEYNSIQAGIHNINSRFNENSKNYADIKQEILNVLTEYESVLTEYSDYYDLKIEKLIEKKLELESHLVGKIFVEEELKSEKFFKEKEQEKGTLKTSLTEGFKKIFNKFRSEKDKKTVDVQMISKMQDSIDIELEDDHGISKKIGKLSEDDNSNATEMLSIEKRIQEIDVEIKKLNDEKIIAIEKAMESKEKWIVVSTLKKPKMLDKVKRFFTSRINPSKIVMKNVIEPLKFRIQDFKNNELLQIKG